MMLQIARVFQRQPATSGQEPHSAAAAAGEAPAAGTREPGYIATLKDNYGFITCVSAFYWKDVSFHELADMFRCSLRPSNGPLLLLGQPQAPFHSQAVGIPRRSIQADHHAGLTERNPAAASSFRH